MSSKLKKIILDSRQFTGMLLLMFSMGALIIRFYQPQTDTSWQALSAKMESEALAVQTFGFLLPPLQSLLLPMLAVISFLALMFVWLSFRKNG